LLKNDIFNEYNQKNLERMAEFILQKNGTYISNYANKINFILQYKKTDDSYVWNNGDGNIESTQNFLFQRTYDTTTNIQTKVILIKAKVKDIDGIFLVHPFERYAEKIVTDKTLAEIAEEFNEQIKNQQR
jgi:hypothetical protein